MPSETAPSSMATSGFTAGWVEQASPELQVLATTLVTDMENGSFTSTAQAFDTTMSQAVSQDQLAATWASSLAPFGELVSVLGCSVTDSDGYAVAVVVADHLNGTVAVQLTFSPEREVAGLFIRPATDQDLQGVSATTAPVTTGENSVDHPVTVGPHELRGTLVTPGPGVEDRHVVVLLLAGSGPQDMDETVGPNAPLRDLADGLAAQGISSLRYNKRYYQDPSADGGAWTLQTEVLDDVDSALTLLSTSPETAGYPVVVAGHSLGGMLLPTILAQHPQVSAGIMLAGSPRDLFDIIADQRGAQIQASGDSDEKQASDLAQLRETVAAAKQLSDPTGPSLMGMPASYVVSLNEVHARLPEDLAAVSQPLLVLQGGQDGQVYPEVDYPAWKQVLEGKDVEYRLFEGLNHLFMPVAQGGDPLDYTVASHVDGQVVEAISQWLSTTVG